MYRCTEHATSVAISLIHAVDVPNSYTVAMDVFHIVSMASSMLIICIIKQS